MAVVTLGVTGSIAAYKACEIASLLGKDGVDVHVVLTESAAKLVTAVTFQTLTGNPVVTGMFHPYGGGTMPHISLADRSDLLVTAPATANILAKYAHGMADDALSTLALSADCPHLVAPAMNDRMWRNPVVQENVRKLEDLGFAFAGPGQGRLACGTEGTGRMAEPVDILEAVRGLLKQGTA